MLLKGEHFDVRQTENGEMIAIVGTIVEEAKVEATEAVKPVNPETELDAE
jgi:hypothetical protein